MYVLKISHILLAVSLFYSAGTAADYPAKPHHGQVYTGGSSAQVWSESSAKWIGPEQFWLDYVTQSGNKHWGRASEYPSYSEVNEHDTVLIEVDEGPCLMYFFHKRWRRAQDVRRWDPAFNELLGCPRVFD